MSEQNLENVLQDEDGILKWKMARAMYEKYCEGKSFKSWAVPYVPMWAIEYAEVALKVLDEDDQPADAASDA